MLAAACLVALLPACATDWSVAFPAGGAAPQRFHYSALAVAPLAAVAGERQDRDATLASELLHHALRERAPFPVAERLLDGAVPDELTAPLDLDGRRVDGLLSGRMRFSRRDRSTWDSSAQRSADSQGNPVFQRRTAYRLELWLELRNLATGAIDLQRSYADEVVYDSDGLAEERDAFLRLLGSTAGQFVAEIAPAAALERRTLLPWPRGAQDLAP
jgi:hypothetical protein